MWNLLGCQQGRVVVSSCLWQDEIVPRTDFELHQPPKLLFVGYLRPEKGVATLLEAFANLRRNRTATLTLVGGSDRSTNAGRQIQQQIESHPFASDIRTAGMVDFGPDLFELYRTHDLCILPSLSEGTPRTLVEARAFGCPVVSTRVGGIPASVRDGEDGLLVDPGQPAQLAKAIERILDDDTLRRRLILAGRERFGHHTVEQFASDIVEEIEAVAHSATVRN
jgi:glycosyltransferase involved in cell wall biosynthesis